MKNLLQLISLTTFFLILFAVHTMQAQIDYGTTVATNGDTYVINGDRTNIYSALRLQTSNNKAFMLTNKGAALSFHYSTNTSDFNNEGNLLMSLSQTGNLNLSTLNIEGFLIRANSGSPIVLHTGGTERMRISNNGNVGIGNASPNAPLHLQNTLQNRKIVLFEVTNNDHEFYGFGVNSDILRYQVARTAADHVFSVATANNASRDLMRIYGSGGVKIGSSSIPVGLTTEIDGTTPLLNLEANFRFSNKDNAYRGASFRIDTRNNNPLFQWIKREAGSTSDVRIMSLNEAGTLDVEGNIQVNRMYIGNITSANVRDNLEDATGTSYYLWVEKGVVAEDFAIAPKADWDDYVFNDNYELPTLEKVAAFVKANKHLPNIPSEKEVKENGYTVHEMNRNFLKTMEEMTLYAIEQEQKIAQQQQEIEALKAQVAAILAQLSKK